MSGRPCCGCPESAEYGSLVRLVRAMLVGTANKLRDIHVDMYASDINPLRRIIYIQGPLIADNPDAWMAAGENP